MTHTSTIRRAMPLFALALLIMLTASTGTSQRIYPSDPGVCKTGIDVPMNYRGREMICLYNLERLLDAKQEWARDTRATRGSLVPSAESLEAWPSTPDLGSGLANAPFRRRRCCRRSAERRAGFILLSPSSRCRLHRAVAFILLPRGSR